MNEERLPESFDVLIVGTGVTESIVSAAVSRNGHSVLHLDPRDYYGGVWATLNFDCWLSGDFTRPPQVVLPVEHETSQVFISWSNACREFEDVWYSEDIRIQEELTKNCRRFNIDVCPKVVLAREEIIELLIKSNVSRYLEFLRVGKLFTSLPHPSSNVIESIPLSRSDIFTSKSVSLVEKRSLVKFIEAILKPDDGKSSEGLSTDGSESQDTSEVEGAPTFEDLAKSCKLSEKVKHLVRAAVRTLEDGFTDEESTEDIFNLTFVNRCKNFLQSIGRFGNQTPYLWTLYGISEICQAFCRLSAVYGGLFILKRYISGLEDAGDEIKVKSENDDFKTKFLVMGSEMEYFKSPEYARRRKVSRTVCRGVLVTSGGTITSEVSKPGTRNDGIYLYKIEDLEVVEMNHSSQAVPKDYRLLQVTSPLHLISDNPVSARQKIEAALSPFIDFCEPQPPQENEVPQDKSDPSPQNPSVPEEKSASSNLKPKVLYGSYFLIDMFEEDDEMFRIKKGTYDPSENMGGKVLSCATGTSDISAQVEKAKEIFHRMFPEEEFLPKAPDMAEETEENGFSETEDHIEPAPAAPEPEAELQDVNNVPHQDIPIENDNIDGNANE